MNPDEVIDYRFVDEDDMELLKEEEGFLHYERIRTALEEICLGKAVAPIILGGQLF